MRRTADPFRTIICLILLARIVAAPADVATNGIVLWTETSWLELTLSGEPTMVPRVQLTAVPYAINALNAGGGGDDGDWVIDGDDVYHELDRVGSGLGKRNDPWSPCAEEHAGTCLLRSSGSL